MSRARRLILIVDSDHSATTTNQGILEGRGYSVRVAHSASEAEREIHNGIPDLVMMDVCLGGIDGSDLMRRLRHHAASLRVCFVSGEFGQDALEIARSADPVGYLVKPVSPQQLLATVHLCLPAAELAVTGENALDDKLTGLPGREAFLAKLRSTSGDCFAAVFDMNHAGHFRDRYGDPAMDNIILALSQYLAQTVPAGCFLARWAEHAFAVLVKGVTRSDFQHVVATMIGSPLHYQLPLTHAGVVFHRSVMIRLSCSARTFFGSSGGLVAKDLARL